LAAEPARETRSAFDAAALARPGAQSSKPVVPQRVKPANPSGAANVPESGTADGVSDSRIDKQSRQLTPLQLAENEYRRASELLQQGQNAAAEESFSKALQVNPAHTGARQGLFGLLVEAKKIAEAERLLQEGLVLNPNQPGIAIALARLQFDRGDPAAAIETLQQSAPSAQNSPDYLAFLAALLQRRSRHAEAVDQYRAALRLAPQSGVWLMGLGISLQALDRNAEARNAFERARSSNTLNPELQAYVEQRLTQLP
jgi:MSHA biogenesis protein MshN